MPSGWHRADIIAAIHKRGTSLRQLSLRHGLAESTLRAALQRPATPSNQIISRFLGVPLHELWPDWFDLRGRRLRRGAKTATGARGASSQKRDAA